MIKFSGKNRDGRLVFGFGISEENVKRLKDDNPILINLEDLSDVVGDVVIFYGETEEQMEEKLRALGIGGLGE